MKPAINDILELTIDRLTYNGGRGIGRHFNFAIFVEGATAPNDKVEVLVTKVKKNYAVAQLKNIIVKSEHRTDPPCQHVSNCGGCQWQHLSYKEQIKQKKGFIEFTLKRLGLNNEVHFLKSEHQYNYRNRIQLHFKNSQLGFFQKKTNNITPIDQCLIASNEINQLIQKFKPQTDVSRYEFSITQKSEAVYYPLKKKHPHNLFSQINNFVNEQLIQLVINNSQDKRYSQIYDAYCGNGNFTFPIHNAINDVPITGIELSDRNIKLAQSTNTKIDFKKDKVENYFRKSPAKMDSLVILDPPRSGCDSSLFNNIKNAKQINYISCDLATFERDCKELLKIGFKLKTIYGLDMFPQTYHLETFAVFEK